MRGGISTRLLSGFITILVPPLDRSCFAEKVVDFAVASSAIEFHSPQSEHCPDQRGCWVPQFEQTNRFWGLANFFTIKNFGEDRSEEHTSELQSLMRISYAVLCLKKKRTTYLIHNNFHKSEKQMT